MKVGAIRSTVASAALLACGAGLFPAAGYASDAALFGGIVDYGLYLMTSDNCTRPAPIAFCNIVSNRHIATTTTVPACLTTTFGFRYRVPGLLYGAPVAIRQVVVLPPAGIRNPAYPPVYSYTKSTTCRVGDTCTWAATFDYPWELVPGPWRMEIWSGSQLIARKTFDVVPVANRREAGQDANRRKADAEPCQPSQVS